MIIAHDLGTTGNKASLHADNGHLLAQCTVAYDTRYGSGGRVEQDPGEWYHAVVTATRQLMDQVDACPEEVRGVGLSGQMMGAVLLDENHEPVRPAMIWADHRATLQAEQLLDSVSMESAYAELGHRINPTYSLAKVMWVRDNEPAVWARTRHVCLAKDYVTHRLTGVLVTDPSDASSTNAYDQELGAWSPRLLSAAGLSEQLFPPVVPSASVAGGLTAEAARETGLPSGLPVVVGGGDGPMAAVGAGVIAPEDGPYCCLGSSSWISVASDRPLLDPQMRSMTFNHVIGGRFVPTATMQAGAASLQWVAELLGAPGEKDSYSRLLAAAGDSRAADDGLFFLPYLMGERSPLWNPSAAGSFVGLQRYHGQGHLVRAVLEGVAFNLRTCMDAFVGGGIAIEQIDAIGGGARSDVWLQVLADVWGIPVLRRTIVEEANSLGAAVTALVALGITPDFTLARSLSTTTAEFQPEPKATQRYAQQHEVFLDAYTQLEPWFPGRRGAQA